MSRFRWFALALLLMSVLAAQAADTGRVVVEVAVTASSLKMRAEPRPAAHMIGGLMHGEHVLATPADKVGWLAVLDEDGHVRGYVSNDHVRFVRLVSVSLPAGGVAAGGTCGPGAGRAGVAVDDVHLECPPDNSGTGITGCTAYLAVSARSACAASLHLRVRCQAEFAYLTRDVRFERIAIGEGSGELALVDGSAHGEVLVNWHPPASSDPVTTARVSHSTCVWGR